MRVIHVLQDWDHELFAIFTREMYCAMNGMLYILLSVVQLAVRALFVCM